MWNITSCQPWMFPEAMQLKTSKGLFTLSLIPDANHTCLLSRQIYQTRLGEKKTRGSHSQTDHFLSQHFTSLPSGRRNTLLKTEKKKPMLDCLAAFLPLMCWDAGKLHFMSCPRSVSRNEKKLWHCVEMCCNSLSDSSCPRLEVLLCCDGS